MSQTTMTGNSYIEPLKQIIVEKGENPEAVMRDFGLEDNEIKAVMTGETKEIEKLTGTKAVCINIVMLMKDDK